MTDLLIRLFIKDYTNTGDSKVRIKHGNLASVTGIICNLFLCILKFIIGLLFNSVAIIADAVNNLTDAANSIITFAGFIISGKPADKNHPYGHARYEYLACLLVSFVILILGLSFLKTSFLKILKPEPIQANMISIIILVFAIVLKLWMCLFFRKIGNTINSNVLLANSKDSLNDVISTAAVLVTTLIAMFSNINLDGIAGCIISVFIIYTGITILKGTVDELIGTTPDPELINKITSKLKSYEDIIGIHDLVVHSYGPGNHFATVHVEVSSNADILTSHDIIDNIERDFSSEFGINMVIHLDPVVTDDLETNNIRETIISIVKSTDEEFTIHDFRMIKNSDDIKLIFDILVPGDYEENENDIKEKITNEIKNVNSDYTPIITVDKNYI